MKKIHLGIIIAIICGGAIIGTVMATKPKPIKPADTSNKSTSQSYSMATVAEHNKQDDCWTVINDKVYDITPYVSSHPGGSEILRSCGIDGTSLFRTRKTTDGESIGSGTPHSSSAQRALEQFKVGSLAK